MDHNKLIALMENRAIDYKEISRLALEEFGGAPGFVKEVVMEVRAAESGGMAKQRLLVALMHMMEKADEGDAAKDYAYSLDPADIPGVLKSLMENDGGHSEPSGAGAEGRDA